MSAMLTVTAFETIAPECVLILPSVYSLLKHTYTHTHVHYSHFAISCFRLTKQCAADKSKEAKLGEFLPPFQMKFHCFCLFFDHFEMALYSLLKRCH